MKPTYQISITDSWSSSTKILPEGATGVGTITGTSPSMRGALIYFKSTDTYACTAAGITTKLDQELVKQILKDLRKGQRGGAGRGQGRKTSDGAVNLLRKNVRLDQKTIDCLTNLGDGNLSLGIRKAASKLS